MSISLSDYIGGCCGAATLQNFFSISLSNQSYSEEQLKTHKERVLTESNRLLSEISEKIVGAGGHIYSFYEILLNQSQKVCLKDGLVEMGFKVLYEDIPNISHGHGGRSLFTVFTLLRSDFKPLKITLPPPAPEPKTVSFAKPLPDIKQKQELPKPGENFRQPIPLPQTIRADILDNHYIVYGNAYLTTTTVTGG